MDFTISDEHRLLRDEIIRFARNELSPGVIERDRSGVFPRDLWLKCGEMGLQGLPVPEEYGGAGLDPLGTALALEALGYGCEDGGLTFAICAHLLACVVPVWKHGTEEQKQALLPALCSGRMIAVNGMTEPGSGSDAFAMHTQARRNGAGYRLTGRKTFGSNGPVADVALVYALTDATRGYHGGVTAFVVPTASDGFSVGQKFEKMGLRTSPISELVLEDVCVPDDAVLGGVGGGTALFTESMEWERICIAAVHVGTMQRLLEQATSYARTRTAFGRPIGKHQAVAHRLVDMKVRLEASRLLVYRAASRLDHARDIALDASLVKLFVSESLVKSALDAVQTMGGYGFMTEYHVERVLRDAVGSTLYSGTSEIQRNIMAGWMGL
ncbi:MAG TPA: acyl-CoA dehydrogenase family protein [Longimicrobiales bacterium]|nr:acyl-CoA dehydrogenase family protein [Longimicrobiales bacterium]